MSSFRNPHQTASESPVIVHPPAPEIRSMPGLAEILDSVEQFLRKYISFSSQSQSIIVTLWIAAAHVVDAFDYSPYLHVYSPMKRCGKSILLELVALFVPNPWVTVSPSPAVVFRKIEQQKPTLLLDEVDTIYSSKPDENSEGLRALLNAGFKKGTKVSRCCGPNHELKEFAVFGPKLLAGIGKLPDTVADRSIPIELARKTKDQVTEKFRERYAKPLAQPINDALVSWASNPETLTALANARPVMPTTFNARQEDVCEGMLAIADAAGEAWPTKARAALAEVFGKAMDEDENLSVKLLAEIRKIFERLAVDKLSTHALLNELMESEDAPWVSWWEGDISANKYRGPSSRLAKLLKPFSIVPGTIRIAGDDTPKGYRLESFREAWNRYL